MRVSAESVISMMGGETRRKEKEACAGRARRARAYKSRQDSVWGTSIQAHGPAGGPGRSKENRYGGAGGVAGAAAAGVISGRVQALPAPAGKGETAD